LVEHRTENPGVGGSIPPRTTTNTLVLWPSGIIIIAITRYCLNRRNGEGVVLSPRDLEKKRGLPSAGKPLFCL
jgi:hypothetical protein